MTTLVLEDLRRDEATPFYTPATHPLRDIKPDPWMLRNLRATADNIASITAAIDISRNPATAKERSK